MVEAFSERGLLIGEIDPLFAHEDPRETGTVLGEPITVGETPLPDANFPGWRLTTLIFPDEADKEGCIFSVAPNTATPIGIVGESEQKGLKTPAFTEYIIAGSGTLLIKTPNGDLRVITVSAGSALYRYGPGTEVAYIAGPEGLVGVNIGEPPGIPEDTPKLDDPRISQDMRDTYIDLTSPTPISS